MEATLTIKAPINLCKSFSPLNFLKFTYSFPSVQSAFAFQGAF